MIALAADAPAARAIRAAPEPDPAGPAHISPTSAKTYLGCSLKFWFEKIAKIARPCPVALHCGKAVHAALQAFHVALWRGGDSSAEAVGKAYEDAFVALERDEGPVDYADAAEREKTRAAGARVVGAYLESPEALKGKPMGVEVMLAERIPGLSVPLTGAMDLVRGDLVPVDFKSAGSRPDPEFAAFDHEMQLVSYQLLLESGTGMTPPSLDLVYLVKTVKPQVCRVSAKPADRHRKDRVIRMLDSAVEGIASGRFHPQPSLACGWCQFRAECMEWEGGDAA